MCNLCGSAQVKYVAAYPDVGKAICCVQGIGWACHRETRGDLTNSVERARRPMFDLGLTARLRLRGSGSTSWQDRSYGRMRQDSVSVGFGVIF